MSMPDDLRRDQKRLVLLQMLDCVGDLDVVECAVEPTDAGFVDVLATTWRELLDDGLIDDKMSTMGHSAFRLTPAGWIRALAYGDRFDDPKLRDRCIRLARSLKAVVKGRPSHFDELADLSSISAETRIPDGWICNALRGRLLSVVFPKDKWDARLELNTIWVSPAFGLNHLFD